MWSVGAPPILSWARRACPAEGGTVVLSEREGQVLELIERQVLASDPHLAALLTHRGERPPSVARPVTLFVVSALLVAVIVGLLVLDLGAQACLVMLVAAWPMAVLRSLGRPAGWPGRRRR
jgi:hypothetical protein